MHGGDRWMWHDSWGWGGWTLMAVAMALFWVAIIAVIVFAVRYLISERSRRVSSPRARSGSGVSGSRAEDVLAERYAQGEIDDDEYRRRIALLREHKAAQ
ncbi:SHOCT domain-containing protein [[Mycobacterium] burgundiense]|uniref:SHOCT domain-containing protein n=2 Tax=[Mycobacterium] burgundiense TaxID=3064286 RepID=A0ABM9LVF2_9MYCO|nr:SHOCT domain-containing protein [Mycolicibacterium sp. MU0053]